VDKRAHSATCRGLFHVGVFEDDGTRFSTQLKQKRLDVLPRQTGDDASDKSTTSEIDLLNRGMRNQGFCHRSGIRRSVINDVETTVRQPSLSKDVADCPENARAQL